MIKLIILLKRRPGMSLDDFIEYYENKHVKLAVPTMVGVKHYERRYLRPVGHPVDGLVLEPDYDVITEVWFEDYPAMQKSNANLGEPAMAALLIEDEEKLFDRAKIRMYAVEQEEATWSGFPPVPVTKLPS
jgi:hypothetical protein